MIQIIKLIVLPIINAFAPIIKILSYSGGKSILLSTGNEVFSLSYHVRSLIFDMIAPFDIPSYSSSSPGLPLFGIFLTDNE